MTIYVKDFLNKNNLTLYSPIPVAWSGWECDSVWYICTDKDGNKVLVATDHGSPYIGSNKLLKERLKFYKDIASQTEIAIGILKGQFIIVQD